MMANSVTPEVAFLGPEGTYTHQAALELFGERATYTSCNTINKTCESVLTGASCAVVPHENSSFGIVVETYDCLQSSAIGSQVYIRGEVAVEIEHCLVTRQGVYLADVTQIISHEQALGQCSEYIFRYLSHATLIKCSSTSAAAQALLTGNSDMDPLRCAAICSRFCTTFKEGLNVVAEAIQNTADNYTRFYILAPVNALLSFNVRPAKTARALLSMAVDTYNTNLASVIQSLQLWPIRLDRRPSRVEKSASSIYFIEVQSETATDLRTWEAQLRTSVKRVSESVDEVKLIGLW